ncbi:MAG: hypothetical protein N2C14_15590 [Planctomycetales bacterium]
MSWKSPSKLFNGDHAEMARRWANRVQRDLFQRIRRRPVRGASLPQLEWNRRFLPDHFSRPPSMMHAWLCERLDRLRGRRGTKLNVIAPRGGAKSTIGSLAYPLRCAVENTEPLIWIVSETSDQAVGHLENIRLELTDNDDLCGHYSGCCERGRTWRRERLHLKNGCVLEAFGAGQRLRGRKTRWHRPSLIVCDDLQSERATWSNLARERDWEWFNGMLLKAGAKHTNILYLSTAFHREAVALRLTKTTGWDSRVFSALTQWPERMDLWDAWAELYHDLDREDPQSDAMSYFQGHRAEMERGAELLWPEEEDLYALMRMREDEGRLTFEREKQGRPADPEQTEWPESCFEDTAWFDEFPENLAIRTMALDPSKGNNARRGDYSAFVMLGVDEDGVLYVEADLQRRPTTKIVADGLALLQRFVPHAFAIEANHFQDLLAREFMAEAERRGLAGVSPVLLTNTTPKGIRIRSLGPLITRRRVRFRRRSPGTSLLVSQLRDFPDPHSHDDGPDALEMAVRVAADMLRAAPDDSLAGMDRLMFD